MAKEITQIRVFVSCPSDVEKEKEVVRNVCDSLTKVLLKRRNIEVKQIWWRNDVIPLITGKEAQSVIDKQIKEYNYDMYIGILWKRFGDKQQSGLTPTEGEFQDAFRRKQETGRPVIRFYFKLDEFYPSSLYEAQQGVQVQEFKERIKTLGLYDGFKGKEEFQNKVYVSILDIVEDFRPLIRRRTTISKRKYPEITHYLPRKVYPTKDYGSRSIWFLRSELSQDILTIIVQHNRIVLLSNAGVGKTVELQRIASNFSNDGSPFYPFFVSLNRYANQNLSELFPADWREVPESQLFIILDGLDEIESKNKNDAVRQIELFADQHPSSHIIVSCRTNFYKLGTQQSSGTLRGFSSYILLDLDSREIEKYIEIRLGKETRIFTDNISKRHLQELLGIPFYLIQLVELFEVNCALPQSKAETFEQLFIARIQLDVEHYRTTVELDEKHKTIIETLERVALGMETLGRNYITDDEFQQLVPDETLRILIKHCTVWKKNEGEKVSWQFEHNNFQEYLAARVLSRQPIEIIRDFISFQPDHQRIIPSWVNTLSFLLSISNDRSLFSWILHNEPELAVKCESDKIGKATRIRIFKEIFNNYKVKQIWIDRDKFSYSELAQFGQSDEIIEFLLTEAKIAEHYTTLSNAIQLLGKLKIPHNQRRRTSQFLVKCVLDNDRGERVQSLALIALADLKLNSQEVINQIVAALRSSDSGWVRFGLYYFLCNSDYLDENIEIFLEGIEYVRFRPSAESRETRPSNEHWHLRIGLEKAKSSDAVKKIITYFRENPRDLDDAYLKESIPIIVENTASAYSKDTSILDLATDLFEVLVDKHLEKEARQFVCFFDKTHTRLQAFQEVFSQKSNNKRYLIILAALASAECIKFFVQQYEEHNITDDDIRKFQNLLSWKNPDSYLPFNRLINKKSGNKFILPPKRDFDKERKQRRQRDLNLLFNKNAFLDELKLIFHTEQKKTFTSEQLLEIETYHWDNPYFSDLAIHTLRDIASNQAVSLETITQVANSWNWDWFCISKTYEIVTNGEKVILSQKQQDWIANWCYSHLNKANFKKALITKPNGHSNTSRLAIYLWYFLRRLNLSYPKEVLLDMLSFDWVEGHQMLGIQYLEERLNETDITARILENIEEGIKSNDVLKNHVDYCKRHNIEEILPFALHEIANVGRDNEVRRVVLETICQISETLSDLEQILPDIKDDFKWNVVEQLVKGNSKSSHAFLVKVLRDGNERDQFKAAEHLIELQNLEGLEYYVTWIKRHKEFTERPLGKSPLLFLRSLESVPFLIELLKISYQDNFVQDDFERLDQIVLDTLTAIALQSDQYYVKIKKATKSLINEYSSTVKNVNFLNVFLEKLEQKYYVTKSEKLDIIGVTKKLEKIWPHY